ncbi:MAG TPA: hypothetical protein VND64_08005 [Pirellulales bacterium]|nr:hypothetical protein [Pirellulales bacterium]
MSPHQELGTFAHPISLDDRPGAIQLSCLPVTVAFPSEFCLPGAPLPFEPGDNLAPGDRPVCFDLHSHELYVLRKRQFKVAAQARAQIHLLTELERAGWREFTAAVFAGTGDEFAEHALRDAIKGINQRNSRIELHQDGDGVRWNLRRCRPSRRTK